MLLVVDVFHDLHNLAVSAVGALPADFSFVFHEMFLRKLVFKVCDLLSVLSEVLVGSLLVVSSVSGGVRLSGGGGVGASVVCVSLFLVCCLLLKVLNSRGDVLADLVQLLFQHFEGTLLDDHGRTEFVVEDFVESECDREVEHSGLLVEIECAKTFDSRRSSAKESQMTCGPFAFMRVDGAVWGVKRDGHFAIVPILDKVFCHIREVHVRVKVVSIPRKPLNPPKRWQGIRITLVA